MYNDQRVAVVVTAYCEEGFVGEVLRTVPAFVDRIYVIDDASPDGTWAEIRETADQLNLAWNGTTAITDGGTPRQRVVPIRHEENRGYGGAVKTGYRHAYADGMDVVAVMDGDGQMDPAILSRIIDPVAAGSAAYAKGNRLSRPEDRGDMSSFRHFGNRLLSTATKLVTGYWGLTDAQNGYTAISREAIGTLDLDELYDRYGFLNQLLAHLNANEFRVTNVRMAAVYGDETSSIRYRTFVPRMSVLLLGTFWWRLRTKYLVGGQRAPASCYLLGGVGTVGGLVAFLVSSGQLLATGRGLLFVTLSLLMTLLSTVTFGVGILLDRSATADLEVVHTNQPADPPEIEVLE